MEPLEIKQLGELFQAHLKKGDLDLKKISSHFQHIEQKWQQQIPQLSVLKEAVVIPSEEKIMVQGTLPSLLKIPDLPVEFHFFIPNLRNPSEKSLECIIIAHLPQSWGFLQSYPDLPGYVKISFREEDQGLQPSFFKEFVLIETTFLWSSIPLTDLSDPVLPFSQNQSSLFATLPQGIHFIGKVAPQKVLKWLQPLVADQDELFFHGVIEETESPMLKFDIDCSFSLNLEVMRFSFTRLHLYSSLLKNSEIKGIEWFGAIEMGSDKKKLTLPFLITPTLGSDQLIIASDFEPLSLTDFDGFLQFVGGAGLNFLPFDLSSVVLKQFKLGLSLTKKNIDFILFDLGTTTTWELVPNLLAVEQLHLAWYFNAPFSKEREIDIEVRGVLKIADVGILLRANYPDYEVTGSLAPGETINLSQLLTHFIPSISGIPNLLVTHLQFNALLEEKEFTLYAETTNDWIFNMDPISIALTHLSLKIAYNGNLNPPINIIATGYFEINGVRLSACLILPNLSMLAMLEEGSTIPLGSLLGYLGIELPMVSELIVCDLSLNLNFTEQLYSILTVIESDWSFSFGSFDFALKQIALNATFSGKESKSITVQLSAAAQLGGVNFVIAAAYPALVDNLQLEGAESLAVLLSEVPPKGDGFLIAGALAEGDTLSLDQLLELLPDQIPLPIKFPINFQFTEASVACNPQEKWLILQTTVQWVEPLHVEIEGQMIEINRVSAKIKLGESVATGGMSVMLIIQGKADWDGVSLRELALTFEGDAEKNWALAGSAKATFQNLPFPFFDQEVLLKASYQQEEKTRILLLSVAVSGGSVELISLDDYGSLSIDTIQIALSQHQSAKGSKKSKSSKQSKDQVGITLSALGTIEMKVMQTNIAFDGTLTLAHQPGQNAFIFEARTPLKQEIPFPLPGGIAFSIWLTLHSVAIIETKLGKKKKSQWSFESKGILSFSGLYPLLQNLIAEEINYTIKLNNQSVAITVDHFTDKPLPVPVKVPYDLPAPFPFKMSDYTDQLDLGNVYLDMTNFTISISNDVFSLSADVGIGLSKEINVAVEKVFKLKNVFRVYNPKDRANTFIQAKLDITDKYIAIDLVTSPFNAIRFERIDNRTWCFVDIPDVVKCSFTLPKFKFSFQRTRFEVEGVITRDSPINLPIKWLKPVMRDKGMSAIADALPDVIPFDEWKTEEFAKKTAALLVQSGELPAEAVDALNLLEKSVDRLPDRLLDYFNVSLPDYFYCNISIDTQGSVRFHFSVVDKTNQDPNYAPKSIKFLYPISYYGVTVIIGIRFKGIGFGELFSGNFFNLNLDMEIDLFDLPSLAAAVAMPQEYRSLLIDSKQLQKTLVLDNVFILLFFKMAGQAPVFFATPIFFDDIGVDYVGLEGFKFSSHWSFPEPTVGLLTIFKLLIGFISYITSKEGLLKTDDEALNDMVKIVMGPNYVELPPYLGGYALGAKDDLLTISVYKSVASLLNSLKTFSSRDFIQAILMDYRKGETVLSYGPLLFQGSWLLTTPQEIQSLEANVHDVVGEGIQQALRDTEARGQNDKRSLALFFKGQPQFTFMGDMNVQLGLIGSLSHGFALGMEVSKEWGGLSLKGLLIAKANRALSGELTVYLQDRSLFEGQVECTTSKLSIQGNLDLILGHSLRLKGSLAGTVQKESFLLNGKADVSLKDQSLLTQTLVEVSPSGLKLTGALDFFAQSITVSGEVESNGNFSLQGHLDLLILGGYTLKDIRISFSKKEEAIDTHVEASIQMGFSLLPFSGQVDSEGNMTLKTGSSSIFLPFFALTYATATFSHTSAQTQITLDGKLEIDQRGNFRGVDPTSI